AVVAAGSAPGLRQAPPERPPAAPGRDLQVDVVASRILELVVANDDRVGAGRRQRDWRRPAGDHHTAGHESTGWIVQVASRPDGGRGVLHGEHDGLAGNGVEL